MFKWLKHRLFPKPIQPIASTAAGSEQTRRHALEDHYDFNEIVDKIAKQAFTHIYSRHRHLTPVYRDDVHDEEYAEANCERLPLVYFWNQKQTKDGTAYSLTVNGYHIRKVLDEALDQDSDMFKAIRDKLLKDIEHLVGETYKKTTAVLPVSPRDYCAAINVTFDEEWEQGAAREERDDPK